MDLDETDLVSVQVALLDIFFAGEVNQSVLDRSLILC
jgi:hypothetical protein